VQEIHLIAIHLICASLDEALGTGAEAVAEVHA
jgi:hypothetical protein